MYNYHKFKGFHLLTSVIICCLYVSISGCASNKKVSLCYGESKSSCIPRDAVVDESVNAHYYSRLWKPQSEIHDDLLNLGMTLNAPDQNALVDIIGPVQEEGVRSIANKIWMIENAKYTIDASYYIYTPDLIGQAMLGAMCNAVQRGVDVRLMVDSIGSFKLNHSNLKALIRCGLQAGYARNEKGETTTQKARAQVVVFNAISKIFVHVNRRSHDKILVKDGRFPNDAMVMTGGRNASLDYYGLTKDGGVNLATYKDLEILLKTRSSYSLDKKQVGEISELYYDVIFLNKGNKKLKAWFPYKSYAKKAQEALKKLKGFDEFKKYYNEIDESNNKGFDEAKVRLAHELENLRSKKVVKKFKENLESNSNSIVSQLGQLIKNGKNIKKIKVVSPYFFLSKYYGSHKKVIYDAKIELDKWLAADEERTIEIITNSILTSDNFMAQSIIDMDMGPRMMLSESMTEKWRVKRKNSEMKQELINSDEWKDLINNPRIKVYELGQLNAEPLGGDTYYGKLHAKFILTDEIGFVGTTNLDYRSRLFNNEMGFFFKSESLHKKFKAIFDDLKSESYLWGSKEWLEMRNKVREIKGYKGFVARKQRFIYKFLKFTGLKWEI